MRSAKKQERKYRTVNTAAPHALKKRLLTLALSLAFLLTCLPAALAVDLNVDAGFYFKQSRGGTCTLASAAMMLRPTAWANGLAHSFTYKEMQVGYATLPSGLQSKTAVLISLLEQHPEGIVLYDRTQPHAVLLTDYTNGIFYCSDPAGNIGYGRIPITSSSVSIARASCYWYVTADHNSVAAQADGLRLEGVRYPVNIRTGSGMTLTGTANSATGTTLTSVQVAILDAADQTVQSAAAQANAAAFSLNTLDSQIRFGELPEGSYSYMVLVTDSTGESLCFASDFTVSGSASSTQTYWSVKDAEGTKLQQTVQQMETTVETAAETTVSWFAKLFD